MNRRLRQPDEKGRVMRIRDIRLTEEDINLVRIAIARANDIEREGALSTLEHDKGFALIQRALWTVYSRITGSVVRDGYETPEGNSTRSVEAAQETGLGEDT